MLADTERARDALLSIPPDLPRDEWVRAGMAAQAAGLDFDAFNDWSAGAGNYSEPDARDTWRSFKPGKGVGAGTLFKLAAENGWRMNGDKPRSMPTPRKAAEPPRKSAPGMSPAEVWSRCEAATDRHPYIVEKQAQGVPLDGLRVLPAGDALRIAGEPMAGALVLPVHRADGSISSLQFITLPDVAARLKSQGKPGKLNLPGATMEGFHTVGEVLPGGVVHICEGVATAWACWQATGAAAVACCGWGRVRAVAAELRGRDASARLVLVPDMGKEQDADKIAQD
ncbi:MAG: PriCT-2 domain-containing protein, partial [Polaromonas sp.]